MSKQEKAYWDALCAKYEDMEYGMRSMQSDKLDREVQRMTTNTGI